MAQYYNELSKKTKREEVSEKYEQRMREKKAGTGYIKKMWGR